MESELNHLKVGMMLGLLLGLGGMLLVFCVLVEYFGSYTCKDLVIMESNPLNKNLSVERAQKICDNLSINEYLYAIVNKNYALLED